MTFMKVLYHELKQLVDKYGVIGLKHSFEDEGVTLDEVIFMRRLTDLCNLSSFVKVGGCEAKSNIYDCIKYGIDGIIAPMVETKFALSKFISVVSKYSSVADAYVVIESKTAYRNIEEILQYSGDLKGIIVGRSDFSSSYDLDKSEADSDFIYDKVEDILRKAKTYNLYTTLGGNICKKSISFIKNMYFKKILNRVETRNVVIELSDTNIDKFEEVIAKTLVFESSMLKYKHDTFAKNTEEYSNRIKILMTRV